MYVSAQNAFDAIERERFASGEGDTMATLQSAELLILDDLGTEYISPYVNSCLYSLVNTRVCRRLPTIYTSNIVNDADLQRRYTEKGGFPPAGQLRNTVLLRHRYPAHGQMTEYW